VHKERTASQLIKDKHKFISFSIISGFVTKTYLFAFIASPLSKYVELRLEGNYALHLAEVIKHLTDQILSHPLKDNWCVILRFKIQVFVRLVGYKPRQ